MMFEPLAGRRHVEVTDSKTRIDFLHCVRQFSDIFYPNCRKIVLVMDNLNTRSVASLYAAFPPEEALRLARRLEIHHTPRHGSRLNMAETEIGVMSRQYLKGYLSNKENVCAQVQVWVRKRNEHKTSVNWKFTTADARRKLNPFILLLIKQTFLSSTEQRFKVGFGDIRKAEIWTTSRSTGLLRNRPGEAERVRQEIP